MSASSTSKLVEDPNTETESENDPAQVSKSAKPVASANNASPELPMTKLPEKTSEAARSRPGSQPESRASSVSAKKRKASQAGSDSNSDSDSDVGKGGGRTRAAPRGVRQPLKRGGKKF